MIEVSCDVELRTNLSNASSFSTQKQGCFGGSQGALLQGSIRFPVEHSPKPQIWKLIELSQICRRSSASTACIDENLVIFVYIYARSKITI